MLKEVATGSISGYLIDQTGVRRQIRLPDMVVPGIVCNTFSVLSATKLGTPAIFDLEGTRIETGDFTIPLQQIGERRDLYTLNMELGRVGLALNPED